MPKRYLGLKKKFGAKAAAKIYYATRKKGEPKLHGKKRKRR